MFFKVKWEGWEDPTLEPASNFFQRFSSTLMHYGIDKGVHMDIFREWAGRGVSLRQEEAVPWGEQKAAGGEARLWQSQWIS